jgi:hypothetical protein
VNVVSFSIKLECDETCATISYRPRIIVLFLECDHPKFLEFCNVPILSSQYFFTALSEVETVCGLED